MMVFGLLSSAVVFLGVPLLLTVLLREALLACTPPRRPPAQAQCDACGYPVAGLQGMTCPECGGDLLVNGIRTAASEIRRRGNLFWGLLAWTAFMAIGTSVLLSMSMMFWGLSRAAGAGATQTSTVITIAPISGSGPTLQASANITTTNDTGAVEQTSVVLSPAGGGLASLTVSSFSGFSSVHWTDASGAFRQPTTAGGSGAGGLNAPTASAWLTALGPGQSAGLSDEEVSELARIVGELSRDPSTTNAGSLFTLATTSTASTTVPSMTAFNAAMWLPGVAMLVALGLWIVGLVYIPLRRRALRSRFGVTPGRARTRPPAARVSPASGP